MNKDSFINLTNKKIYILNESENAMHILPKHRLPLKGMSYLSLIVLMNTISLTLIIPIIPIYIKNFVSSNAVTGYVSALLSLLAVLYIFLMIKLLKKIKKSSLLKIGLLGSSVTAVLLAFMTNIQQFIALEIFRIFLLTASSITIGLFVREFASRKTIGESEGVYFATYNFGWVLGPLLGGLLASAYSFNTVFIISAIPQFLIGSLLLFVPLKEKIVIPKHEFKFLDYFKSKQLSLLYIVSMGLTFWWTSFYIFMPLFANTNGFSAKAIGIIMFLAVIPLTLLEYPIGKLADKNGFRKYIALGFFILAFLMLFTYLTNPFYTLVLIVLASGLGAGFIEPLTEAYFFKEVKAKEKEQGLYPVYKTSVRMGDLVAPLLFSTILVYFNFKILFVVVGLSMLFFSLIALKLKK